MTNLIESLRGGWFLIIFVGGIVWWAAHQDTNISDIQKNETRITVIENRINVLETGIGQLQATMDGMREDLALIKGAVIK